MSEEEIIDLCDLFTIENYTITDDGKVDVHGDVDLRGLELPCFPVEFGIVYGHFKCDNNKLTSLEGSPNTVNGNFDCSENQLTDLEHCPKTIGEISNKTGVFYCTENKITTLKYCPEIVGSAIVLNRNNIIDLEGFNTNFGGNFFGDSNPIGSIFGIVQKDFIDAFRVYKVIKDGEVNLKRLRYVMEMFDQKIYLEKIEKHYKIV